MINGKQIRKPGIPVAPRKVKDVRLVTQLTRLIFGIKGYFCDVVGILEKFGTGHFSDYKFEIIADNDPILQDAWAITTPHERTIRIKESVYNNACNGEPQSRFTIAHELGHLFLHHKFDETFAREKAYGYIETWRDSEWQADTFAAEILMPKDLVRGLTIEEICKNCGVSHSAAETRLRKLNTASWQ
jgi:putative toxin-antitoxin system, toxin component